MVIMVLVLVLVLALAAVVVVVVVMVMNLCGHCLLSSFIFYCSILIVSII